jgi:hypothetical protein
MIYTAFAMVGTFSFAALESLQSTYIDLLYQGHDKIFSSPQDYYIQCPAEEPALTAARGNSSLPRGGSQRFIFPWVLLNYGAGFSGPSLAAIDKTQFFNVRNTIRLNLRI